MDKFWLNVVTNCLLGGIAVGGDAIRAPVVRIVEVRVIVADGGDLAESLDDESCGVAVVEAHVGSDVAPLVPMQTTTSVLIIRIEVVRGGGGCRLRLRPVRERGLRFPVASRDGASCVLVLFNVDLVFENVIGETESLRIEVEVPVRRRVVLRLAILPGRVGERRRNLTMLRSATEVLGWELRPEVATVRLGRVADIAGLAAPGLVAGVVNGLTIAGWARAEGDVEDGSDEDDIAGDDLGGCDDDG